MCEQNRDKICRVKRYFSTGISERSEEKRPSEAREQTAGVWGRCKPPNGARGEAPKIFEISSLYSAILLKKVLVLFLVELRKFCPRIAVSSSK